MLVDRISSRSVVSAFSCEPSRLYQLVTDGTSKNVGRAAGSERDDQAYGLGGVFGILRQGCPGRPSQCGCCSPLAPLATGQRQGLVLGESGH